MNTRKNGVNRWEADKGYRRRLLVLPVAVSTLLLPSVMHAATIKSIIETSILPIFTAAISLIMTLSVLAFILGIIRFMYTAGDDKSRTDGKKLMIWGTLSLFLMVAVWGVVAVIKNIFFG